MKDLIKKLNRDIPSAKDSVLTALFHPERNNLWDKAQSVFEREMHGETAE